MRKRRKREADDGMPTWITTYGDMMSLLLTFFIFLFAFSTVDKQQFQKVMEAFQMQGILTGGKTLSEGIPAEEAKDLMARAKAESEFRVIIGQVQGYVKAANLQDDVKLELNERGLTIRMTGQVLFSSGQADMQPSGIKMLDEIGKLIANLPNNVMVEGHTDDLPINNNQFENNWVLSSIRATTVIKYFIERCKITPSRLSAAGYGEFRPLVPNTSEQNRAKNRRVDIVILKTGSENVKTSGGD